MLDYNLIKYLFIEFFGFLILSLFEFRRDQAMFMHLCMWDLRRMSLYRDH